MKQDSFSKMMRQIGAQADAEERAEIEASLRRARWAKIRRMAMLLALLCVAGALYANRAQIDDQWQKVLTKTGINHTNEAAANFGGNLKSIQDAAAKRDELVGTITGK